MPLLTGKKNFGKNVKELVKTGRPVKQAVAIAYSTLREKKRSRVKAR